MDCCGRFSHRRGSLIGIGVVLVVFAAAPPSATRRNCDPASHRVALADDVKVT